MESSARTLQQQLDSLKRKYSTAETILKDITQERESAVSQLVVAYGTVEELKRETESLKEENTELKARITYLSNGRQDGTQEGTAKEDSYQCKPDARIQAVKSMKERINAQKYGAQQKGRPTTDRSQDFTETPGQRAKALANKNANTTFDLSSKRDAQRVPARASGQNVQIDDNQDSEDSVYEAPVGKAKGKGPAKPSRRSHIAQDEEASRDLTYLSFIDVRSEKYLYDSPRLADSPK